MGWVQWGGAGGIYIGKGVVGSHTSRIPGGSPLPPPPSPFPQVTQLGHVKDLATAFVKILGNPKAAHQVYNVAGER